MTEATEARARLGARLRELRRSWDGVRITQQHVAEALGLSPALVSSWENGKEIPPPGRLRGYAWFFATRRSMNGRRAVLVPEEELTQHENERRRELMDELGRLRAEALNQSGAEEQVGALGGWFWHFPDVESVTILCTPFSDRQLGLTQTRLQNAPPVVQYTKHKAHPNAVRAVRNADIDSLLELVGHIRAENPRLDVRWTTFDEITSVDQLTGHLVILGGGDPGSRVEGLVASLHRRLELSGREVPGGDPEFDFEFVVSVDAKGNPRFKGSAETVLRPEFLQDEVDGSKLLRDGLPVLESDVALLVRKTNPLNPNAKVTLCSGLFSRGTYGAVRALTDERFRGRNETYLREQQDPDDFWMLVRVLVAEDRTVTPDLAHNVLDVPASQREAS
jgi:transcriptional regulator with XRE-family HTH domain